jgi:uncharacterized protein YodC (DUF2158 family)
MKIVSVALAATVLLAPPTILATPAAAQSVFDGTWKVDPATAEFGGKPTVRTLKDGVYSCPSCSVPWSVPADGAFHPIKGHPYTDDVAVTVVDPTTVKFAFRKAGKVNDEETVTLSGDGATATFKGIDTSAANGTPVSYETQEKRLAPAAPGAHALSGSWRALSGGTISDAGLTVTMKTAGDTMTMSYPTGESVTAKFGGPAAAVTGDPGKSMVKLAKAGASSFTATTMRKGKVTSVATISVAPDGRMLTYAADNKENGATARYTATKQ